jgi:hypothetical protein
MILANVILATQVPYVMATLFCFLVIPIETAVLFWIQRPKVAFAPSLGLIVLANVVSCIAGYVITALIPVPSGFTTHESRPEYFRGIVIGFVAAFLLSWLIEHWVVSRFHRRFAFHDLRRATCLANLASYIAVFIAMMAFY